MNAVDVQQQGGQVLGVARVDKAASVDRPCSGYQAREVCDLGPCALVIREYENVGVDGFVRPEQVPRRQVVERGGNPCVRQELGRLEGR